MSNGSELVPMNDTERERLTPEEKRAAYDAGRWACAVPPVCTELWDAAAWIRWIDRAGRWGPDVEAWLHRGRP